MKTVIKGGDAVKTYARRDSAAAALKKLGVKASDYNMFISQTTDGRVAVALDKAEEYLAARLRKVATEEVPQKQLKGRTEKEAATNQIKRPSVAGVIRKYILDGLDNKAIHELLKRDFGHDEDKAHYPAWYRSQMRREGLIDKNAPRDQSVKTRATAAAKKTKVVKAPTKVVTKKQKRERKAERKKAKASAKAKPTSQAQNNINQAKKASIKTGGAAPVPGRLSITIVS